MVQSGIQIYWEVKRKATFHKRVFNLILCEFMHLSSASLTDWQANPILSCSCNLLSVALCWTELAWIPMIVQEEIARGTDAERRGELPFPHWICQPYVRPLWVAAFRCSFFPHNCCKVIQSHREGRAVGSTNSDKFPHPRADLCLWLTAQRSRLLMGTVRHQRWGRRFVRREH